MVVILGSLLVGGAATAGAGTSRPAITDYIASPNVLPYTGGTVKLSASVAGAVNCTFSSIAQGVSGLPTTVACGSGTAAATVVVDTNTSEQPRRIKISLTALGATSQSSGTTTISEAPAPPPPEIAHFIGTPDPVPYTGGTVTLSATVNNASLCTFSSTSAAVSGLPTTVACDAGSALAVVSVVANTVNKAMRYPVELTAAGAARSTVSRTVITLAPTPPPSISSYSASPSPVSWTGGPVTLSATVANATTCTFSAMGQATRKISGLPVTVSCTSGMASVNVTAAANHRRRAATLTVKLTATGAGAKTTTTTNVSVSPVTTPPTISGFTSSPSPVPSTGGPATLTATVANAVSCTFSSKNAAVSGLPVTVPCSVGAVSTTVSVPKSTGHRSHSYLVKLTVHGVRKRASAATLVTVAGHGTG